MMGISFWSCLNNTLTRSLQTGEREPLSTLYLHVNYSIKTSFLITMLIPSFHNPILFLYLRNIFPLGSLFNCCCQYFWSYFETHPGCMTCWPLDSGSSVIPTKTTVNLPSWQSLLFFFFFQWRKINFLPFWCKCSWSHLLLLGNCDGVN